MLYPNMFVLQATLTTTSYAALETPRRLEEPGSLLSEGGSANGKNLLEITSPRGALRWTNSLIGGELAARRL